jgi:ParB family chromosome partitioning protein
MVDENLVRRDISFAEMAALAQSYLNDQRPRIVAVEQAVEHLYASASRQKRGHIRVFAALLSRIGAHLSFPEAIPRALGTDLAKKMEDEPEFQGGLVAALKAERATTPERELALLREWVERRPVKRAVRPEAQTTAKTTFRLARPEGSAKCTVAHGRVDLRLNRDFTAIERDRLEAAVKAFFETLDG